VLRSNLSRCSLCALLLHLSIGACARAPTRGSTRAAPLQPERSSSAPPDSFAVSGLRGTLSQLEIQRTLEPKLPKLLRCVEQRLASVEVLAGKISFSFHVATNGHVVSVSPNQSELGDREAERCMLQIAEAAVFPEPHGGEADFAWPLEVPLDPDVRPPVELRSDVVRAWPAPGALRWRLGRRHGLRRSGWPRAERRCRDPGRRQPRAT
jgi:hypothetical protein